MQVSYPMEDITLINILDKAYGIQVEYIYFIPMGDSAYSYRVNCANGDRYYLKLFDHQNDQQKRGIERLKYYLPLTSYMYHQSLFKYTTFPIKTLKGDFQITINNITTVLFNFIQGETLADAYPFSEEILTDIAQSVAAIQQITPYIEDIILLTEEFDISFEDDLEKCMIALDSTINPNDYIKQALREQVMVRKARIFDLLNLVRELRGNAINLNKERVLCHGDIWGGNLIRHENKLYFIDWESAILAPPEFDLVGYIGQEFEVFLTAYEEHLGHSVEVDLDLLRFYSYRHHLRNLTNWLMNILYRNTEQAQNENDLEMILYHCINRWDSIEARLKNVEAVLEKRK
ncbi:phosphotransferase [Paenibacillus cremeus]|uniref:Phosphotransferase n=2 Tax=Paenibacillus cremeus TaxID=2163881 RepID=A0A559JRD6_9BACL|nr:phosphotransferase [Paenibacillus cremeus]